ncbi:MAG: 3-oxoacyl-ACP synthase [Propionibacteriaceae bacterium]|jgi:3-oxoacyl-[acyl-carrier-protein] synthase-3|nr:3-oxoacyl-ACP synthase [Propionibacteriaceae bacterium]
MARAEHIGILGYGLYIPDHWMTAQDISDATGGVWSEEAVRNKLGIVKKPIPGPGDGTQAMGSKAAQDALDRTGLDPKEIDVILCVGEEWKEWGLTTSALVIQNDIGAENAWGIDVANRCCSTCTALMMAKDMLLGNDDIDTILIAGGYRNGDFIDYRDSTVSMMFDLGAAGGAFIVQKNMDRNLLLGTSIKADGSLVHTAGVQIGYINEPFRPDTIEEGYKSLRLLDAEKMKNRLNEVSLPNWYDCIDQSLAKSGGLTRQDIDYLGILHFKRSQHLAMLAELGLTEDQTTYLEDYGHLGQIDQMLTVHLGLESGKIQDGSVVCLVAAGIGYTWASTVVRWGQA